MTFVLSEVDDMYRAVLGGRAGEVRSLLSAAGGSINDYCYFEAQRLRLIHVAAGHCNESAPGTCDARTVRLLLELGADPDLADAGGRTALHCAASAEYAGTERALSVVLLLSAGADADARGPLGKRPLHFAIDSLDARAVDALLAGGADPNAETDTGTTPLDAAALLTIPGQLSVQKWRMAVGLIGLLTGAGARCPPEHLRVLSDKGVPVSVLAACREGGSVVLPD